MALGIAAAMAAAVAFGWSTALMHHSTFGAPRGLSGTRALLGHVIVQRVWLIGMAASLTGTALHFVALRFASLALVQPLVVTGLVFAFIFRASLDRRLPSRNLMRWVMVTAVGLALFVVAAGTTQGSARMDEAAATWIFGAGAAIALTGVLVADRTSARNGGVLLGVSAGVVFGLIAGTIKATTNAASHHVLLSSWPLYALAPLAVAGFLLNQRAYHRAPLANSLPALNIANPLVAVVFGVLVFHERPSGQPAAIAAECVGLLGVLAGIFFLARHEELVVAA